MIKILCNDETKKRLIEESKYLEYEVPCIDSDKASILMHLYVNEDIFISEDDCVTVSRLKKENKKIEELLMKYKYDYLTGFLMRRDFQERIEELWNEKTSYYNEFYLVLIDLDNLHDINRTQGYDAGDEAIIKIAKKLRKEFSQNVIFRVGGDEFVILIRDGDKPSIKEKLKKINNCTYAYVMSSDYSSTKEMFKDADEKLIRKKDKKHGR
jgi:GGDEF domain-containing protein